MKLVPCTLIFLVISFATHAQEALTDTWVTNSSVNSITRGDGKIFLGGGFDWIGPSYGSAEAVFSPTLTHDDSYPRVGQNLHTSVADGAGGWYITTPNGVSHLRSNKTVDELDIEHDGFINTIEKLGNILYIAGSFDMVNGVARKNLAAFDLTTGALTSWNPDANSYVNAIVGFGSTIYAGGAFTSIGGQPRQRVAALDASTGLATSWDANVAGGSGVVYDIVCDAGAVYFAGFFSNAGGGAPARTNFAAVNTTTGALLPFNPRPSSFVYDLLLDGNTIYIAGSFLEVAATPKRNFAAMDVNTGTFTSLAVTFSENADITALAVDGQKLFIGGTFAKFNDEDRPRLAVVNKTTGVLEPMDAAKVSQTPYSLVVSDGKILAIADDYFVGVAGITTPSVVALDEDTGQPVAWTPEIPALVGDEYNAGVELHYQDNRVYYLQTIYHSPADFYETALGALNATDGSAISTFEVLVNDRVADWTFSDDAIYLMGQFTEVNGEARAGFAAVDLVTGDLLPWTIDFVPDVNDITSIAVHNNVLYVAGEFFYSDGEDRQNLAAWDATTGELTDWAPEYFSDFSTPRIGAVSDTHVYIIGNGIYRVDAVTGESDDGWLTFFNEVQVFTMVIHESAIYVGGYTNQEGTATIARLDIETGAVTGTQPVLNDVYASEGSGVSVLALSDTKLLAGGSFVFNVNETIRAFYAEYLLQSSPGENSPPQIQVPTTSLRFGGTATIDLEPLITDPDDNLDVSTLQLMTQTSEQGAAATLNGLILTLDYTGLTFVGTDHITIRVCDLQGECAEQELTIELTDVEVVDDIVVYNAVSPNGDQKNDFLMLEFINFFGENKVSIFNRWGDLVFDVSDYNNTDRVFAGVNKNGNELPSGTYFYKIEFPAGKETIAGYLSLQR